MQIYNPSKTDITLNGILYAADENGIITVPDDKINSSVWTQGFVSAHNRLAGLARPATTEPIATPAPAPVPSADVTPKTTKSGAL